MIKTIISQAKLVLRDLIKKISSTYYFGIGLFTVLLVANIASNPTTFDSTNLAVTIGFAAPIIIAAFAVTPTFLMGNGGIDLSVGPVMGLVNVVVVYQFVKRFEITSPLVLIPVAVFVGMLFGLINGLVVSFLRIQSIVATLGMYLICSGLAFFIAPTPGGESPQWMNDLGGRLSVVPIIFVLVFWWLLRKLPFYEHLMAYGGDDRAVYTSGISVKGLRMGAFILGGFFSGIGGLSLSGVLGSADPSVGPHYTMLAISAVALGGTSLAGGRGGMFSAVLGSLTIYLLQNLLTFWNVSNYLLEVFYGLVLVVAVAVNGQIGTLIKRLANK
jgi:ribose transport system permease protein